MRMTSRILTTAFMTAFLAFCPVRAAAPEKTTTCIFPKDGCLGKLYLVEKGKASGEFTYLGPAAGTINVPTTSVLMLAMTDVSSSKLANLKDYASCISELRVSNTDFRDEDVSYILPLKKLRALHLDGTLITDAGVRKLGGLPELEFLNLNETDVTGAGLKAFKKLRHLDAMRSDVTDKGLECLRGMDLRELRLNRTRIGDATLASISGASQISMLLLDDTKVTNAGALKLRNFSRLEQLHLCGIKLLDSTVATLGALPLTWIAVSNTGISDDAFAKTDTFSNIHYARLANNKISDVGLEYISRWKQVRDLDLSRNPITDRGVAYLRLLPNLKKLTLVGTNVTDESLKHLASVRKLTDLAVSDTKISKKAVIEFQRHHPQCRITHQSMFD